MHRYTYLCVEYLLRYLQYSVDVGTHLNVVLMAPIIQTLLSALNWWWTWTLLRQLAAKRKKQ